MAKRIIDGEGLWRSEKIARINPTWMRAEYANLLPLALANGVFELDARRIWSLVYSYNRTEISFDDVDQILKEFERVGLLLRFFDAQTGKQWGYWIGIDKPGRLPSGSRLQKRHETTGPTPPADGLQEYGQRTANQWLANGEVGFGFGSGSGLGTGKDICADSNRLHDVIFSTTPEEQLKTDAVARVWDYYVEKLGKNRKLLTFTSLRQKKGLARLSESLAKTKGDLARAEELMRIAIDNLAASAFHVGQNDKGKRYDSWEKNLFGTAEQFERWLDVEV